MNKVVKVVSILLMVIILTTTVGQVVFAAGPAIDSLEKNTEWESDEIDGVKSIAVKVITAIRNISVIVAVVMISVLGIKYMVGSAEEKAGYKKTFVPLIVGAILVVSAAQIAKMLFSLNA